MEILILSCGHVIHENDPAIQINLAYCELCGRTRKVIGRIRVLS